MKIRPFQPEDEAAVIALWEHCGLIRPWNDPHQDIRRKLAVRPEWFLVGELEGMAPTEAATGTTTAASTVVDSSGTDGGGPW